MSFVIIGLKKFYNISLKKEKAKMLLLNTGNGVTASYECNSKIKERAMYLQGDLGEEPTAIKVLPCSLHAHISLPRV